MKKIFLTLLSALAVGIPMLADTQAWVGGIRYSFSNRAYGTTEKYECSTYKPVDAGFPSGSEYSGDIVIPEEVEFEGKTYVVTAIGYQTFYDQANVTSVVAPASIEKIDTQALSGTSISSFIIPEKVQSLSLYPFMNCKNLTELVCLAPKPPTTVSSTFQGVDQTKVKLLVPKGCVDVYKGTTRWMGFSVIEEYGDSPVRPTSVAITRRPSLMLAATTSQLECEVFPLDATDRTVTWKSLDTSVATVTADGVVTAVKAGRTFIEAICNGDSRVSTNFNLTVIDKETTVDGIKYRFLYDEEQKVADAWVIRDNSYAGEIVIPERVQNGSTFTVKGIDSNAFALNENISAITIPQTIDTIGFNAFRNCNGLKTVNISNLGAWANIGFRDKMATPLNIAGVKLLINGQELSRINIDGSVKTIKPFTFSGINSLLEVTFSDGTKCIGRSAFDRCPYLAKVTFAESIDSIGPSAFANCPSLEAVELPLNLRTIASGAFSGCSLRAVNVPNNVTVIDNQAFQNNTYLKEVTLPESLRMIYLQVFAGCPAIEKVTVKAATPPEFFSASSSVVLPDFNSTIYQTATLYVPQKALADYKAAYGWKQFTNILPLAEEKKGIEAEIGNISYMLYPDEKTAEVTGGVPADNTITIPAEVTYENTAYEVTAVADSAFYGLKELKNITLGDNISNIGKYAFAASGIDIVAIPQKVLSISDGSFADCTDLVSVSLPDNLKTIGVKAFFGSQRIRYIFCNNKGGTSLTPPSFSTYEGDPTNYGEAFSTEIWPDCQLVIPANMFSNYKKCNGWKNFRAWVYWHDYDLLPTAVILTPSRLTGEVGKTVTVAPSLSPANAVATNFIINGLDSEMINLTAGKDNEGNAVYQIELLKTGVTAFTVYCGLNKTTCEIEITEYGGIDSIGSDDIPARYFNLQGIEIRNPKPGETVIEVRGDKSTKVIFR